MNTSEAILAAADAHKEGLLGKYPLAAQVLAEEVFRLRGELDAIKEKESEFHCKGVFK
jgi:hypothetical protein